MVTVHVEAMGEAAALGAVRVDIDSDNIIVLIDPANMDRLGEHLAALGCDQTDLAFALPAL